MQKTIKLEPGKLYHIYNKGNNSENIFIEERNYDYFLEKYTQYIEPIADTFAYCLLRNHFHFAIRIKSAVEQEKFFIKTCEVLQNSQVLKEKEFNQLKPSQQFSNFFNSYTKSINKEYGRTGKLFEERFERKRVNSYKYLKNLIHYIHFNPQKHGFVDDFMEYPHSSYGSILSEKITKLNCDEIISLFEGKDNLITYHAKEPDEKVIKSLIEDDDWVIVD